MLLFFSVTLLICVLQTTVLGISNVLVPGATWYDTSGNVIQAHGGGFLKVDSTYYWFGEDKAANSALFSVSPIKNGMKYALWASQAVSCYTSTDLLTWTRQNNALTPIAGTMISSSNIVERPKGVYCLISPITPNSVLSVLFNTKVLLLIEWTWARDNHYSSRIPNMSCGSIRTHPSMYTSIKHWRMFINIFLDFSYGAAEVGVATAYDPCGPYTYIGSFKPLGADSRDMGLFQDGAYSCN